ncbi:heparinase II/III domain-containing protein [Daejeonella lutea]|uniref:Heparinase II/III-like protein n=1 Tax=Daejeonella lutea TaxID=572036 RepID=A0A1T5A6X5_9SPHI|nr:heparinase II/III family protein [Daejeonella lutea]SKB30609.1 Heparinase II/III-like protein [Daejeonella lutea]
MIKSTVGFIVLIFTLATTSVGQPISSQSTDNSKIEQAKQVVQPLLDMSLPEVMDQVPAASGLNFIGCPNCHGGAQDMGVLNWEPVLGSCVKCKYCSMVFPNEKFPYNKEKVIIAPSGAKQVYRYHESKEGAQYFFEAHAWYERWKWIQSMATELSQLWSWTRDEAYGDRAAVILGRFAQVFPDYAIRYDYPSAKVKFFPADQKWPYEGLTAYRGAKWYWWGYGDIPADMAKAYSKLQNGYDWKRMDKLIGIETAKRIENDLLIKGYEFTAANPETFSNMSPGTYRDMVIVGRTLNKPEMVHDAVTRFREFLKLGFFADGWWKEGTVSYHDQTVGSLRGVALAAQNYTDPPEWKGERYVNLDLIKDMPFFKKAIAVSEEAVLPNGRKIPINDTWAYRNGTPKPTNKTVSRLWPSLGNAALGVGEGKNQTMVNVNWSGNYGHSHYDNGSIILFAQGGELLSDIGYTHGKYRGWTIHTASHNTVVIDQKPQDAGTLIKPVTGKLLFYDDRDPHVKAIDVDASPAYSTSETYRRRLVLVHAGPGRDYIIDRFDVKGGKTHDWFLHGMCEEDGILTVSIQLNEEIKSLVPDWGGSAKPKNQYEADLEGKKIHAYSYLKDIKSGQANGLWTATWKYQNSGLRTHNLAQTGTEVFSFKSPTVRRAEEDDNKLDQFMGNGIMQRHKGGSSSFVSIHEPFQTLPWIKSVSSEDDTYIVNYELDGKDITDRITLVDTSIHVTSGAGWDYKSGESSSGSLLSFKMDNGIPKFELDKEYNNIGYIRLEIPEGGTGYYRVRSTTGNWLTLEEDPGFMLTDQGKLKYFTFPHSENSGPLRYTVFQNNEKESIK